MRLIAILATSLPLVACESLSPPTKALAPAPAVATTAPASSAPASKGAAPAKAPAKPVAPVIARVPPALAAIRAPAPLDLKSLEQRLKDTAAVGVMTKLSLKNQVDDLIARFRAFHAGQRPPMTIAELRQPFELLLMKVLSLLQDKDAQLARDINASRDAIWGVLADRDKLAQFT